MQNIIDLFKNKPKVVRIIALFIISITILIVILSLANNPASSPVISKLALGSNSYAHLYNSEIYSTDGDAFMKTNIKSGDTTTLLNGLRIPTISSLAWVGDKGVIVKFSGSVLYTKAQNSIDVFGSDTDQEAVNYSWYIDFTSKDIRLITRDSVVSQVYYDTDSGLAYYAIQSPGGLITFQKYNPSTGQVNTITDISANTASISSIYGCDKSVCAIAINQDGTAISSTIIKLTDHFFDKIASYTGIATHIDNPSGTLVLTATGSVSDNVEYTDAGPYDAKLYIANGKTESLGSVSSTNNYYGVINRRIVIISDNDSRGALLKYNTKSLLGLPLTITKDSVLPNNASFSSVVGQSDNFILLRSGDSSYYLLSDSSSTISTSITNNSDVSSLINSCSTDINYSSSDKQYTINVFSDSSLETTIKQVSDCIHKEPKATNYSYHFVIVSPTSGRIISN